MIASQAGWRQEECSIGWIMLHLSETFTDCLFELLDSVLCCFRLITKQEVFVIRCVNSLQSAQNTLSTSCDKSSSFLQRFKRESILQAESFSSCPNNNPAPAANGAIAPMAPSLRLGICLAVVEAGGMKDVATSRRSRSSSRAADRFFPNNLLEFRVVAKIASSFDRSF